MKILSHFTFGSGALDLRFSMLTTRKKIPKSPIWIELDGGKSSPWKIFGQSGEVKPTRGPDVDHVLKSRGIRNQTFKDDGVNVGPIHGALGYAGPQSEASPGRISPRKCFSAKPLAEHAVLPWYWRVFYVPESYRYAGLPA